METVKDVFQSRVAAHSSALSAQKLGRNFLRTTFYLITAVVVVSTLFVGQRTHAPREMAYFLALAVGFLGLPTLIEKWDQWARGASDPEKHFPQRRHQRLFLFLYVPVGVLFTYWALRLAETGFFPIIPLFVLAGYSTSFFSLRGTVLCSFYILGGIQYCLYFYSDYIISWPELFGMEVGMLVFNSIFLIAKSAENARLRSDKLACELEATNAKLRDYALRVEDLAISEERNRLAREIHDSLGHALTVVNVQVEAARTVLESDPPKARAALEAAQAYTRQGLKEVREAVSSLRAGRDQRTSLESVIEAILEEARRSGLEARRITRGTPVELPAPIVLTLQRALQEALTNTLRHASATRFTITTESSQGGPIALTIEDDGVGAESVEQTGFGLLGLRERIGHHGGETTLRSAPGEGFTIHLTLPLG